jgi:hypothetical protein
MKLVSDLAAWTPLSSRILEVDQLDYPASAIKRKKCSSFIRHGGNLRISVAKEKE